MSNDFVMMKKCSCQGPGAECIVTDVAVAGDIRQFHEDSSSEDTSPSDHKNTRSRSHGGDRWVISQDFFLN